MLVGPAYGMTKDEVSVTGMSMLAAIGFVLLWKLIHPLNRYRIVVFALCVLAMVLGVVALWNVFILAEVSTRGGLFALGYALAGGLLMWVISLVMQKRDVVK